MQLPADDEMRFDGVLARLRAECAVLPIPLREPARSAFERLAASEFSQIAALLPWWLAELVPLDDARCAVLARAGIYAWWHAQLFDELLDAAAGLAALPLAQHALFRALDSYAALGLLAGAAWADLAGRLAASAAAYAEELRPRPVDPATVSDGTLAAWTPALLMDRAAPFGFAVTAQLCLAGVPDNDPRLVGLPAAVRALTGARQIADDASDWLDDLRAGQLNWVAAGLIRDFRTTAPAAEGSLERLAGYELRAERFWEEVERSYHALCDQALAGLTLNGPCRLGALVQAQRDHDSATFALRRERRASLRALFGASAL